LEGAEDRLSIFDLSDPVCVVESVDIETAVAQWQGSQYHDAVAFGWQRSKSRWKSTTSHTLPRRGTDSMLTGDHESRG